MAKAKAAKKKTGSARASGAKRVAKKTATKTAKKAVGETRSTKRSKNDGVLSKREAKHALDRLTSQLRSLRRDVDKNFWEIGNRLAAAQDLALHEAAGFDSIADYAETMVGIGRAQAFVYMRVAGAFSESVATTFGVEKLERGLRYIAKTPEEERPEDVPELRIAVPDEEGKITHKRFENCSVADLKRAVAAAGGKTPRVPAEVRERIADADAMLDEAVGEDAARHAAVTFRLDASGGVLVDVRGVPYARARAALAAISKAFASR